MCNPPIAGSSSKPLLAAGTRPAAAFSQRCRTLQQLIDRNCKKPHVGTAVNGYYTPPEPKIEEESSDSVDGDEEETGESPDQAPDEGSQSVPDEDNDVHGDWGSATRIKKKKNKKPPFWGPDGEIDTGPRPRYTKAALKEKFVQRKETVRQSFISILPVRKNQDYSEDYSEIFLCHARLYVFADLYDVQPLKFLALEELQATLAIFDLYVERASDIVSLLRYVYGQKNASLKGEGIRTMLTQYVGCEMDTLIKDETFRDLIIEDGGPLLGDLLGMVGKRIC